MWINLKICSVFYIFINYIYLYEFFIGLCRDENELEKIVDLEVIKFDGWLEDENKFVLDFDVEKFKDW